jgi:GNAT superfamily N-acetyltransferase
MPIVAQNRADYVISTDKTRLDIPFIHKYLSERSYWAHGRLLEVTQRSIENSLCFGVFQGEQQIGFARVVTDYATFAWLCDVFMLETTRGQGFGKWLIATVTEHEDLQNIKNFILATSDAHELYRRYGGFEVFPKLDKWMYRPRKMTT